MTAPGRLAVVAPLTGPRGRWGSLFPAWVLHHPEVEVFDDAADPERSVDLARSVAGAGRFSAVVGHFSSEAAEGALPAYRSAGIPVAFPLSSAPAVTREHLDPQPGVIAPMPDNLAQADALWRSPGCPEGERAAWAGPSATGLAQAWTRLGGRLRPSVEEVLQGTATTLVVLGTLTDAEQAMAAVATSRRAGRRLRVLLSDDSWVGSPSWDGLAPEDQPVVVSCQPDPAVLVERCSRHMLQAVQQGLGGHQLVALWASRYGASVWGTPAPVGVGA